MVKITARQDAALATFLASVLYLPPLFLLCPSINISTMSRLFIMILIFLSFIFVFLHSPVLIDYSLRIHLLPPYHFSQSLSSHFFTCTHLFAFLRTHSQTVVNELVEAFADLYERSDVHFGTPYDASTALYSMQGEGVAWPLDCADSYEILNLNGWNGCYSLVRFSPLYFNSLSFTLPSPHSSCIAFLLHMFESMFPCLIFPSFMFPSPSVPLISLHLTLFFHHFSPKV